MPHIVFAGQRIPITAQQIVELKDRLQDAAQRAVPAELSLVGPDGDAVWLLWTPGAPIVINDADVPPLPEFPMPDFSALGLPGFPEPPTPPRRVGF
ncbi:hypothetical protein AX769_08915 [Frondihabitans sp. PAMC 28766]|uniref:hypothetical protein n=1 Tax=Frondihabitans sp. PAMC 28766 TaxID=1795630 RepID=UPI00078E9008|nr:hypothetical protein [Frondihabitans sp. PAMC 28766]AMM20261.1 hypothetical protein AX769_08915 [Frondihabitans sp. PAMC 28766]